MREPLHVLHLRAAVFGGRGSAPLGGGTACDESDESDESETPRQRGKIRTAPLLCTDKTDKADETDKTDEARTAPQLRSDETETCERERRAAPRQRGDETDEARTARHRHGNQRRAEVHARGNAERGPAEAPRRRGDERGDLHQAPRRDECKEPRELPRWHGDAEIAEGARGGGEAAKRKRSRYIPAAERREVFQRDAGRCTYVDARGERCCETRYLELHHLHAFAKLGANVASNLTLRCRAHNALAAEEDFGAKRIAERRDTTRHEALAAQTRI